MQRLRQFNAATKNWMYMAASAMFRRRPSPNTALLSLPLSSIIWSHFCRFKLFLTLYHYILPVFFMTFKFWCSNSSENCIRGRDVRCWKKIKKVRERKTEERTLESSIFEEGLSGLIAQFISVNYKNIFKDSCTVLLVLFLEFCIKSLRNHHWNRWTHKSKNN